MKDGAAGPFKVQEPLLSTKIVDDLKFSINCLDNSGAVGIQEICSDRNIGDLFDLKQAAQGV